MRRLLLVRPEPGLSASKALAETMGLTVITCPLFEVVPLAWEAPELGAFDALLVTSANTLRQGGSQLDAFKHLPVFAVGEATAQAARDAGFQVGQVGGAGVGGLLDAIPADVRLLHLGGKHRVAATPPARVRDIAVYESRTIPAPAIPSLVDDVIAIHSPRAGRRFFELVGDRSGLAIAAISEAAAAACGTGWREIGVADGPSDAALLALAAKLCQTGAA